MAFVNVTVDASALSRTAVRDTGTVGIVGQGTEAMTAPLLIGSYAEIAAQYPSDNDLSLAAKLALDNGASKVWIVDVGASITTTNAATALALLEDVDIQVVCIANTVETDTDAFISGQLLTHVKAAMTERVGVAMLDAGEDASTAPTALTGLLTASEDRIIAVAHNSTKDVAAAVCGMLVKYNPWESPVLKTLKGLDNTAKFTTTQKTAFAAAQINVVTDALYVPGPSLALNTAYTMGATADGLYFIDVRRTLDDIAYKIKSTLTNTKVIGNIQINKTGMGRLNSIITGVLQNAVNVDEIEGFSIEIPVAVALSKEANARSPAEITMVTTARTTRNVDVTVQVEYAGSIHSLDVDIKFTV